eukprot:3932949-Rhodomonas_salina.4
MVAVSFPPATFHRTVQRKSRGGNKFGRTINFASGAELARAMCTPQYLCTHQCALLSIDPCRNSYPGTRVPDCGIRGTR